jgi:hypothetical protein
MTIIQSAEEDEYGTQLWNALVHRRPVTRLYVHVAYLLVKLFYDVISVTTDIVTMLRSVQPRNRGSTSGKGQ